MKFVIEVVRVDERGRDQVLHRSTADEISPRRAKTKAGQLIKTWSNRGASAVRVLNHRGEELFVAKQTTDYRAENRPPRSGT
jgi:hypothetical protein